MPAGAAAFQAVVGLPGCSCIYEKRRIFSGRGEVKCRSHLLVCGHEASLASRIQIRRNGRARLWTLRNRGQGGDAGVEARFGRSGRRTRRSWRRFCLLANAVCPFSYSRGPPVSEQALRIDPPSCGHRRQMGAQTAIPAAFCWSEVLCQRWPNVLWSATCVPRPAPRTFCCVRLRRSLSQNESVGYIWRKNAALPLNASNDAPIPPKSAPASGNGPALKDTFRLAFPIPSGRLF